MRRTILALSVLLLGCIGYADQVINITSHASVGDGKMMNTRALQAALDHCAASGGGTVVIPSGVFLTGSVEIKSHTTLSLSPGAVLRGSANIEDYPFIPFHHNELGKTRSLRWAIGQTNICLAVSNLVIHDSNRGIAIFANDKGWVKDVLISGLVVETRLIAGGWWGKGEPLFDLQPLRQQ